MKRQLMAMLVVATLAIAGSTALGVGAAYMQLAQAPTQLGDGNWEYIYDVYGNDTPFIVTCGLSGFDASLIVNQWMYTYGGVTGTLVQHWDWVAANNPPLYHREPYGSYSTDLVSWMLHSQPWAIDNPWHTPSEYLGGEWELKWLYPGVVAGDGMSLGFSAQTVSVQAQTGLVKTFRIVHPYGPGEIDWWVYSYEAEGQGSGRITGPVPEPASIALLSLGGLALLRRRRPRPNPRNPRIRAIEKGPVVAYTVSRTTSLRRREGCVRRRPSRHTSQNGR